MTISRGFPIEPQDCYSTQEAMDLGTQLLLMLMGRELARQYDGDLENGPYSFLTKNRKEQLG